MASKESLRRVRGISQRDQRSKRSRLDMVEDCGSVEDRDLSTRDPKYE